MMDLQTFFAPILSTWIAIPLIFGVRFVSSLLTEVQTVYMVYGRVKHATLLAGIEDLLYWASIGLVLNEAGRGYL